MTPEERYAGNADALVKRILETFERHPEASKLNDPWGLFKIPGFNCDDIGPTMYQASWALGQARRIWAERNPAHGPERSEP